MRYVIAQGVGFAALVLGVGFQFGAEWAAIVGGSGVLIAGTLLEAAESPVEMTEEPDDGVG